nr:immunoglobulin heavy chain junction region [Macaca mulatta]
CARVSYGSNFYFNYFDYW